jgi:type IV pilus assembly protein PilO
MADADFFEKIEKIKMPIRILILVGTIVLIGGLFVYFIYLPKTQAIKETTEEIEKLNQNLKVAVMTAKKLPQLRAKKAQVDTQFKEALKLLPDKKEIPSLLKKVTQLGNDSKLDFRLFLPRAERAKDFYMEIPVGIEVRGSYHDTVVFFDRVGHMERIMNILNVSMKPVKANSTMLITNCDAVTYRFKGETDATPKTKKKRKR